MHVSLPVQQRSVATARGLVREVLAGWEPRQVDDVALMVSELVTNAVRHSRAKLDLAVTLDDGTVRVDVVDDCPDLPSSGEPAHYLSGGRGLLIVRALADRFGAQRTVDGKAVWFEVILAR
jgi:anti-sigma regulatory factor (Ser/Thr protein kinase)